eukprot:gnl/TRDRNA2_/TRDRNA2_186778_c0_seq1.p1 gnl/TRDRNA2_/TRDRNA2_186778_c0~~gnl/TRDRNA2_/TRDRNA2_186778_c0_seq1.p1  ORF type:complete len:158 (-),score=17.51 gnl/TRDRNA2_/TRDRNA2_186778_c0_seq1:50-523(-)
MELARRSQDRRLASAPPSHRLTCQEADKRPDRFRGRYAERPGINSAASFHEAHFVANMAKFRSLSLSSPFAVDGEDPRMFTYARPSSQQMRPATSEVLEFATNPGLPPIGRPGHAPLPTQTRSAQDSYLFGREVYGRTSMRNFGNGDILAWHGGIPQ